MMVGILHLEQYQLYCVSHCVTQSVNHSNSQ